MHANRCRLQDLQREQDCVILAHEEGLVATDACALVEEEPFSQFPTLWQTN